LDDLNDIVDENGKNIYSPEVDFLWCQHYDVHKDAVLAYMAAASYADECVGVVLDALKKSKYAENTIVILMGDHGWHLGEKLKFRKHTLWRESTQLPLIMHLPGMNEKQECFRNVNLIDLYPTLIDICHLPPKKLDGKSIKPLFENPELQWEPTLTTFQKDNHSVMSEKWHYIIRFGGEELYNLEEDPMEWNNLAHSNSDEIIKIKEYLKSYLPEYNEWELFKYQKDRSVTHLDESIKSKRDISKLK
jgi:arylsulfatase A-like enzyme